MVDNVEPQVEEQVDIVDEAVEIPKSEEKLDLAAAGQSELLLSIMADTDMQAVLTARREGREIKVVDKEEPKPEPKEEKIDTGDPDLDAGVTKVMEMLEKKLAPMRDEVAGLRTLADGYERQAVDQQISAIVDKHKDFNEYRPAMAEMAKKVQGLGIEQLYILAKLDAGKLNTVEPSTHSELPTPTPRGAMAMDTKKDHRRGRKGFQSILLDALEKTNFNPQE